MSKKVFGAASVRGFFVIASAIALLAPIAVSAYGGAVILPQFYGLPGNQQQVLGASTPGNPANLALFGLRDGDLIRAAEVGDPDVYVVNGFGYKRLVLNLAILRFYGARKVKLVSAVARDSFPTSGLSRNCEARDLRVFGLDVVGEDSGILRWVNITSGAAVSQDSNFFRKTFCIGNAEFNSYQQGSDYASLGNIAVYHR